MTTLYNQIGRSYRGTRTADPRIVDRLIDLLSLPPNAVICDVGAGTGNYARALAAKGYRVLAVEPSEVMRSQAKRHDGITWLGGVAEHLPLPEGCVNAVVCTLAAHHFRSVADAAREMHRICPEGPFVIFTMDPHAGERPWFDDYFPEIRRNDFSLFPPLQDFVQTIGEVTGRNGEIIEFPLPHDLVDHFMYAPWNRPETYLDPVFRANTSGFAMADPDVANKGLAKLRTDLDSGRWQAQYGDLLIRSEFDLGYRFVIFQAP